MKGLLVSFLLTGIAQAVRVYLDPAPRIPPRLSASQAGAALSKHLDLERFEDTTPHFSSQQLVFGQGEVKGLLLTIDDEDTKDIIPTSFKKTFSVSSQIVPGSLSALIPIYIERAHHIYSEVYEHPQPAHSEAVSECLFEFSYLRNFLEGDFPSDSFSAFDFTFLSELKEQYTLDDERVRTSYQTLRETIANVTEHSNIKLAIVTVPSPAHPRKYHKRQSAQQPPSQSPLPLPHPAEPIDSISTCYSTAETCGNATTSCSGHGECVQASKAGKTCFVCACTATKDPKGKRTYWAGNACERQDVSGSFVLLAGTTITLLLLVVGSVALLSGIGEQQLPSTLTGGVAHSSR